jgi:hypothetical protein
MNKGKDMELVSVHGLVEHTITETGSMARDMAEESSLDLMVKVHI